MGKDADEIRAEIEETRGRMGDTVDAIAYKTDVRSRVGEVVSDARERALDVRDRVGEMMPDTEDVRRNARSAARYVREHPLRLLIGAAAVGFLIGSLLPTTKIEQERLGPIGRQLKRQAKEQVRERISSARDAAVGTMRRVVANASQATGGSKESPIA